MNRENSLFYEKYPHLKEPNFYMTPFPFEFQRAIYFYGFANRKAWLRQYGYSIPKFKKGKMITEKEFREALIFKAKLFVISYNEDIEKIREKEKKERRNLNQRIRRYELKKEKERKEKKKTYFRDYRKKKAARESADNLINALVFSQGVNNESN